MRVTKMKSEISLPFGWLSFNQKKQTVFVLLILTGIIFAGISILDIPLKTSAAPNGIVSFELAGNQEQAQEILSSWSGISRIYAGLSLGLDYLFLFLYSALISLGCILIIENRFKTNKILYFIGIYLAWAQFGAALSDSLENLSLIQILLGSKGELWPHIAMGCAVIKFIIVFTGRTIFIARFFLPKFFTITF